MTAPTLQLTRIQRTRLMDALKRLSLFDDPEARNLLLSDLPETLTASLARSAIKTVDLVTIVDGAERWGALDDGTPAVLVVLSNAQFHSEGSEAGREVAALYSELTAPVPAAPPPPPAPELSPIARAERYLQLREAVEAGQWQQALDLAPGMEDFKDSAQLAAQAQEGLGRQQRAIEEIADAYAAE